MHEKQQKRIDKLYEMGLKWDGTISSTKTSIFTGQILYV